MHTTWLSRTRFNASNRPLPAFRGRASSRHAAPIPGDTVAIRFAGRKRSAVLPASLPAATVMRGNHPERYLMASAVVVTASGKVLGQFPGSRDQVVLARSAIKPLHAAMMMAAPKPGDFPSLTSEEIAVMCSSHATMDKQVAAIRSIRDKFNLPDSELVCGTAPPFDQGVLHQVIRGERTLSPVDHQCSGHHTALQILSRLKGYPTADYWNPQGALQQWLLAETTRLTGVKRGIQNVEMDNCNIPTVALPITALAKGFARLVSDPRYASVVEAMTRAPEYVGDDHAIDSRLMRVSNGNLVAKVGAEGLICVANRALKQAVALKEWAGHGEIRDRLIIKALRELNWLTDDQTAALFKEFPLENAKVRRRIVLADGLWTTS